MSEILTVQEVCDYLRIAKPTLYRYVRSGDLPSFKMGKIWKFQKHSIDQWVQNKLIQDTQARSKSVGKKTKKKAT